MQQSSATTGCTLEDGASCVKVGSLYVVGKDITTKDGALTGGTFTFDPTAPEYVEAGLTVGASVVTNATTPTTWTLEAGSRSTPIQYVVPVYSTAGDATSGVSHWVTNTCANYTSVKNSEIAQTWGTAGATSWYAVSENVLINGGVICQGHVNLILCDGAKLTVRNYMWGKAGIQTDGNGSFTVYGQSGGTGQLDVTANVSGAGIGDANITINGGQVTASGGNDGAGIGGCQDGGGTNITVNGGTVRAVGIRYAAGIGGGDRGDGANITVNGGQVTASGGSYGAGIGGGHGGDGANITVNGGQVTATGGRYAAGIGGGSECTGTNITVNGGTVLAVGGDRAPGIGGGVEASGSGITISGGDVTANGGYAAAGIGGGVDGIGSDIAILGGTVRVANPAYDVTAYLGRVLVGESIGNGAELDKDLGASSSVSISSAAKILFNVTGLYDAEEKPIEPMAPMPEDFTGVAVLMSGTQRTSRVLVGGVSDWTAATSFTLVNAATAATAATGLGTTNTFAGVDCSLVHENGQLVLKVIPPVLTILQQPSAENGYEIRAETTGDGGVVNYAWDKFTYATTDFHTLTNRYSERDSEFGTISGTDISSADGLVALVWEADDLPSDGVFRFSCTNALVEYGEASGYGVCFGQLSKDGDEWVYEPSVFEGMVLLALCGEDTESEFTIKNLRYVGRSAETVAEGGTLTTFPFELGEKGSDYICHVTYSHAGVSYVADSAVFLFAGPPSVPMPSAPTAVAHALAEVYTNGVLSLDGTVWSNQEATVVYTAKKGYAFADGATNATVALDTTVSPAAVASGTALPALTQTIAPVQNVPKLVNYRGTLADATGRAYTNGVYTLDLRVWDTASGTGRCLWGARHSVFVQDGVFNLFLGSPNAQDLTRADGAVPEYDKEDLWMAIWNEPAAAGYYLGVTPHEDATGAPLAELAEIEPRPEILAAPFAYRAQRARYAEEAVGNFKVGGRLTVGGTTTIKGALTIPANGTQQFGPIVTTPQEVMLGGAKTTTASAALPTITTAGKSLYLQSWGDMSFSSQTGNVAVTAAKNHAIRVKGNGSFVSTLAANTIGGSGATTVKGKPIVLQTKNGSTYGSAKYVQDANTVSITGVDSFRVATQDFTASGNGSSWIRGSTVDFRSGSGGFYLSGSKCLGGGDYFYWDTSGKGGCSCPFTYETMVVTVPAAYWSATEKICPSDPVKRSLYTWRIAGWNCFGTLNPTEGIAPCDLYVTTVNGVPSVKVYRNNEAAEYGGDIAKRDLMITCYVHLICISVDWCQ